MDRKTFIELIESEVGIILELYNTKGQEYAPDSDVTDNFKRHGCELDVKPEIVWAIYAGKHWDAIRSYCKRGDVLSDETLEKRIRDLILYLLLLFSMYMDDPRR